MQPLILPNNDELSKPTVSQNHNIVQSFQRDILGGETVT